MDKVPEENEGAKCPKNRAYQRTSARKKRENGAKAPQKGARKEQSARKEGVPDGKTPRKGQRQGESDPRQGIVPEIQLSHIGTFAEVKFLRIGVYVNMEAEDTMEENGYIHCPIVTEIAVAAMGDAVRKTGKGGHAA